jgi:hypothetical protein
MVLERVRPDTYKLQHEERASPEIFLVDVRLVDLCGTALVEVQLVWCGA